MQHSDLVIIGGGIVGLATGYRFVERFPGKTVTVLEKESAVAQHQTGRNSGVLHSGVYYRPGSLRAQNCRTGKAAMEEFCRREGLPFDVCGKVIVAVAEIQGEFLVVHPFREGNARTIKLLTDLLAAQTGRPLLAYDHSEAGRQRYIVAANQAFKREYRLLEDIIRQAMPDAEQGPVVGP